MLLKRVLFYHLFLLWCIHDTQASTLRGPSLELDSMIIVEGYVLSAETREPLKSRITYKTLPYGNITGVYSFDNSDGSFELTIPTSGEYRIEVFSEGYQSTSEVITKDEIGAEEGKIIKTFYLHDAPKKGGFIKLRDKIYFDQGNARLSEESTEALQEIVSILENNPKMVIQLEGHTEAGDRKSLLRLSERRVKSVKDYLINQRIHHKRIRTKAYGGTRPLTNKTSEKARQINRRVEIRVIKM